MQAIRAALLGWRCSARERLVFFLLFPNTPPVAGEVGIVITRTGETIDPATLDVERIDGRLSKIGDVLGLTRERVRQIRGETLVKIQTILHHRFRKYYVRVPEGLQ